METPPTALEPLSVPSPLVFLIDLFSSFVVDTFLPDTLSLLVIVVMSKPFDYSKWDKIELSDDEEDVHPNIDRESWFRMKHRSRVEREEHEDKDRKRITEEVGSEV